MKSLIFSMRVNITVSFADGPLCGNTNMSGTSGRISSPYFPHEYPAKVHCVYNIHGSVGTKVFIFSFCAKQNILNERVFTSTKSKFKALMTTT